MKDSIRFPLLLIAAPALGAFVLDSAALGAAPVQTRGMASAWALGISTRDGGPASGMVDPLRLKAPLNQSSAPAPWAPAGTAPSPVMPNFSNLALFGVDADIVEVDAHSSGSDMIPYPDLGGAPIVGPGANNWLMFAVSVTNGSEGAPGGHIASTKSLRPVGAEVISYYAARSQNISRALVGKTAVEATALSLGYDGTTSGTADVDALDFSIGVRTFDPSGSNSSMFFPNLTTYYFSTTPSTLSAWAIKYPLGKTFAVDNTGSTSVNMPLPLPYHIYKMDWSGNAWGPIELYRSGSSLGLDLGVDDIDALAINAGNGVVVFSTALITGYPGPQLQINTGSAASTTTLTDLDLNGTRTRVEDQLDLGEEKDDIDGLCGIDPEGGRNYDRLAGLPVASLADSPLFASGASMMGVSLERGVSAMGLPENIMIQVSGWGRATPMDGELLLLVYEGQYPLLPNSDPFAPFTPPNSQSGPVTPNWAILGPFPRGAALGQWELEVPFNLNSGSGRHFALCAVQYVGAAASGQIAAGSLVTQFTW